MQSSLLDSSSISRSIHSPCQFAAPPSFSTRPPYVFVQLHRTHAHALCPTQRTPLPPALQPKGPCMPSARKSTTSQRLTASYSVPRGTCFIFFPLPNLLRWRTWLALAPFTLPFYRNPRERGGRHPACCLWPIAVGCEVRGGFDWRAGFQGDAWVWVCGGVAALWVMLRDKVHTPRILFFPQFSMGMSKSKAVFGGWMIRSPSNQPTILTPNWSPEPALCPFVEGFIGLWWTGWGRVSFHHE